MQLHTSWSVSGWVASTTLATIAFWSIFGACVDASDGAPARPSIGAPGLAVPAARAIVAWDPRACGPPHRVIVELDAAGAPDDSPTDVAGGGGPIAASVPCAIGEITLDVPHLGVYEGRVYAWTADATGHAVTPLVLALDAPVTRWEVPTP